MSGSYRYIMQAEVRPPSESFPASLYLDIAVYRDGIHVTTLDVLGEVAITADVRNEPTVERFATAAARLLSRAAEENLMASIQSGAELHTPENMDKWFPRAPHSTKG